MTNSEGRTGTTVRGANGGVEGEVRLTDGEEGGDEDVSVAVQIAAE
jgi:hypothetical protein